MLLVTHIPENKSLKAQKSALIERQIRMGLGAWLLAKVGSELSQKRGKNRAFQEFQFQHESCILCIACPPCYPTCSMSPSLTKRRENLLLMSAADKLAAPLRVEAVNLRYCDYELMKPTVHGEINYSMLEALAVSVEDFYCSFVVFLFTTSKRKHQP